MLKAKLTFGVHINQTFWKENKDSEARDLQGSGPKEL